MDKEEANRRLFKAARAGNTEDAQAALDAGADVHANIGLSLTPLHRAADHKPRSENCT